MTINKNNDIRAARLNADPTGSTPKFRIPTYLTRRGQRWIKNVMEEFDFTKSEFELVISAASAMDRAEWARRRIKRLGGIYTNRYCHPTPRPELAVEKDSRLVFLQICKALKISQEGEDDEEKKAKTRRMRGMRP